MVGEYGAHEMMEIYELMADAIDSINQFQLYRPYVRDEQLRSILDDQIEFMQEEYNSMVNVLSERGLGGGIPSHVPTHFQQVCRREDLERGKSDLSENQFDDRDVASGVLGKHRASAILRIKSSLEFTDPDLRLMLQQGAINSSEQAVEVLQYMNEKGYYPVPTVKSKTSDVTPGTYPEVKTKEKDEIKVKTRIAGDLEQIPTS